MIKTILLAMVVAMPVLAGPLDDVYKLGPDSTKQAGVPEGKVIGPRSLESKKVWPGTSRNY